MPLLALKAATLAAAALGVAAAGQSQMAGHAQTQSASAQASARVYIVRPGDTLSKIAGWACGNPAKYPALASASGITNPNVIGVGQRIVLACGGRIASAGSSSGEREPDNDSDDRASSSNSGGSNYAAGSAAIPATSNVYSFTGLERLWIAAGGSSYRARYAACIAESESGGRSWATGSAGERGLWQIHPSHGSLSTYDPYGNARAAVIISNNGLNWSQWTTRGSC
jgi:hypothetical protein